MDCGCGGSGGDDGPLAELNPDTWTPGWAPDLGAGCGCGGGSTCGCGGGCNRFGGDAGGDVDFPPVRPVRLEGLVWQDVGSQAPEVNPPDCDQAKADCEAASKGDCFCLKLFDECSCTPEELVEDEEEDDAGGFDPIWTPPIEAEPPTCVLRPWDEACRCVLWWWLPGCGGVSGPPAVRKPFCTWGWYSVGWCDDLFNLEVQRHCFLQLSSQGDSHVAQCWVSGGRAAIGGGTLAKDCVPKGVCSEQQPTDVR